MKMSYHLLLIYITIKIIALPLNILNKSYRSGNLKTNNYFKLFKPLTPCILFTYTNEVTIKVRICVLRVSLN